MRYILLTCFVLIGLSSSKGQVTSIDCMGSLDIGYRDIHEDRSKVPDWFVGVINEEQVGLRFRVGVNYNKQISQRFHLKSGIRFANKGYNSKRVEQLKWGLQAKDGKWSGEPPSQDDSGPVQFKYNMFFIEVPLILRYNIAKRNKFEFYTEAGVAPSYMLTSITVKRFGSDLDHFKDNYGNYNNWQVAAVFGIGANYLIKEKTQLYAQPTYSYDITKLVNAPLNVHLYSIGLEVGCRHML